MKRVLLISLALVLAISLGFIGCGGEVVPEITEYNLAISSTEGGKVTSPGEGIFTYDEGTNIGLVAVADEGYQFVSWTGNIGTITDVEDASTTITINDDCSIVANFALGALIRDWYDLDAIRNDPGGDYILMNDLDSTTAGYTELASATANQGKGWQPIGALSVSFNGQGYEIKDLFINRPDEPGVGLFGYVAEGGVISNVGMVNSTVTGTYHVGNLVGSSHGTVSDSYAAGMVTGVTSDFSVEGQIVGGRVVGGLIGSNYGAVSNSYSTGSVTGAGWVGGLVGQSGGTVSSSYSRADVVGSYRLVGGLVGFGYGTVSNSYSTGNVTGDYEVGGLVGQNAGSVSSSYSSSSVSGNWSVGGLVGGNPGTVADCYCTGSVTGNLEVGGLVGGNGGIVTKSYSTAHVTGGTVHVGGLVGENGGGVVSNSFWDIQISGQATSSGGTGKATVEMKNIATFSQAGWFIEAVDPGYGEPGATWNIVDGQTYPFLDWES